jgi:hypothetical protein
MCVGELDENNAKLLAELEQTRLSLAEADAGRNSLSVNHGKLEEEYAGLCTAVETLGQEKPLAVAAREAEHKKFQDYRIHHCKRLCELWVYLEKAVNEIGMWCLSYPGREVVSMRLSSGFTKRFMCYRARLRR